MVGGDTRRDGLPWGRAQWVRGRGGWRGVAGAQVTLWKEGLDGEWRLLEALNDAA